MVIRSYIEKNNTLILNSATNTGNSPIAELYYGGSDITEEFTRHLLYFDVGDLQERYSEGKLGDLSKVLILIRIYKHRN